MKNVRSVPSIPHAEYFPQPARASVAARCLSVVANDARELAKFWPVLQNMVILDLRIRYHRSVLGFFWTLINPLLMMCTLTAVFSQFQPGGTWKQYAIFLFAGMVPWGLFAGILNECSNSIIGNEGLIRKIYLPKLIFPLTRVLTNLSTCVFSLVALYFVVWLLGPQFTGAMILLPVGIVLLAMFGLGVGLVLAVMNTFYRDTTHVVGVVLQAWYFATPILYDVRAMTPKFQALCWYNPAFPFIRIFQVIIRDGQWPDLTLFLSAAGIATVSLGIGYVTFKLNEDKLVFRL
jgi:ABC-type polysaccharide/polyol phosphate export permease